MLWLHHFFGAFLLFDAAAIRFFSSCTRLPFLGARFTTSSLIIVVVCLRSQIARKVCAASLKVFFCAPLLINHQWRYFQPQMQILPPTFLALGHSFNKICPILNWRSLLLTWSLRMLISTRSDLYLTHTRLLHFTQLPVLQIFSRVMILTNHQLSGAVGKIIKDILAVTNVNQPSCKHGLTEIPTSLSYTTLQLIFSYYIYLTVS